MSRVIQCELILPITAKFIRVCTMYVQRIPRQLAWFHHGSWRVVCTEMNTIFDATFVGHCMYNVCTLYVRAMKVSQWLTEVYRECWFDRCYRRAVRGKLLAGKRLRGNMFGEVFCSLRSHGTRFAYGRLRAQALSQPCLVMGRAEVER